jgi:flagellar biosynthesis repressor protein FlbT
MQTNRFRLKRPIDMNKTMQFRVKPGERLFVNGAAMQFDRKVLVEFLNDVTFLLEAHVLRPEEATTPLKQLYFVMQLNLIEPDKKALRRPLVDKTFTDVMTAFRDPTILEGLRAVRQLIEIERNFEALKLLRKLFVLEAEIVFTDARPPLSDLNLCASPEVVALKS